MKPLNFQKTVLAAAAALTISLLLAACENSTAKTDHDAKSTVAATDDHHDDAGEKLTQFSDQSELFLEFSPLIAGQPASLAAHVTQLVDFKPLAAGKLTVLLSGGNAPDERFVVDAPAVPGIFKSTVTPKSAGERDLTLIVESKLGTLTHEFGPITVYADAKASKAAHGEHAAEGIPFSKEQQWKIDFATAEATKGTARASVAATGTIKAQPDGEALLSAPTAGVLRSAGSFPRLGQVVKKGQVLAMLSPRLGGELDQASLDAGAGKARIGLEQAKRERERMEVLFKDEAIPEKRLFEARANERMAQAEFDAAQARAGQLGGEGSAGKPTGIAIRAPIDGTIADVSITSGAFVAEGAALFHIANTRRLWLEARVPESDIGRLGTPSGAAFTVDGFDNTFTLDTEKSGQLIAVGGVVDAATRTVPVIFEFNNTGGGANPLRLGMSAKVQLFSGKGQEAVLIPASAVQDESGTQAVYVQTGGDTFERLVVQTGAREGGKIAVASGLEPGQRVVSKGAYLIRLSTSKAGPAGHAH